MDAPQRSPEWFQARKGRITASIVGAILGNSPYMNRHDVMRMMVRDREGAESERTSNVATEWGTYNEAGAIQEFTLDTGLKTRPATFVAYEDWFGGSPDSYTSDDAILEVKCPFGLRHHKSPVPFKSAQEQPHYYDQMQACMMVTGKRHCHFYQWTPAETRHEIVDWDQAWMDANMPILRQFFAEFLSEDAADHLAPKRAVVDTPAAHMMLGEWDDLTDAIERATERKKDLLSEIIAMAGEKNSEFAGRKLTLVQKKGPISYAKVVSDLLPNADIEKYRGKSSSYWQIK